MATAMQTWQEKMALQAAADAQKSSVSSGGKFISFKGGLVSIDDKPVPGNKLEGVIIDWCYVRTYYPEFGSGVTTPLCYGMSKDKDVTVPHPEAAEKQNTSCEGCPMDEWGSSPVGKGKACRVARRLAIIPLSVIEQGPEAILNADVYFASVPVMSISNFDSHRAVCNQMFNMPVWGVVSEIGCKPDQRSMFKVLFQVKAQLTQEQGEAVAGLRSKLGDAGMMFTFARPDDETKQEENPAAKASRAAKLKGKK